MEQLLKIIQQIYELLDILNTYTQGECGELLEGYPHFLLEVKELLRILDRIVGGRCTAKSNRATSKPNQKGGS